ncbi:MAG TPA: glycosyltransferase family 4 protein [Propionibacteriaceae bacterium]
MRIGLLSQWYDPEPGPAALPGVLARQLRARGHEVQVLTGLPNYPSGRLAPGYTMVRRMDERLDDVAVRRVALYPNHDSSPVRRFANYASFGASAALLGTGVLRHVDALWVNYSPITVAWPMWLTRLLHRIPCVTHVLDLWPDTLFAGGFARQGKGSRAVESILQAWCRGMYAASDAVAYISPGVGKVLESRGVSRRKLHYVPMWADEDIFRPTRRNLRSELGITDDQIVLLYAGALGEAQGLSTLIDACARVTDPRFVCLVAGSGIAESSLRDRAERLGAANVRFLGRVPQQQMTELLATGDISYVSLRTHGLSRMTMPSKTQSTLAAGRPLLVAAEGDVAVTITDSGAGFAVHPDDVEGIVAAIVQACALGRIGLEAVGLRGREYYRRTFSAEQGAATIERLLQRAATRRAGR